MTYVDAGLVEKTKVQHAEYVRSGVLIGEYDDSVWTLDGQTKRSRIVFSKKKNELRNVCGQKGIDYDWLIAALKTYTILRVDTAMPGVMGGQISYFIEELLKSELGSVLEKPKPRPGYTEYYVDFLRIIPGVSDSYLRLCSRTAAELHQENAAKRKDKDHATRLNEFLSYFAVDDVLRSWWAANTDTDKKLYYYPFYLFWVVTTILPLRVTEYCVTPLDCIKEIDGQYFLTIRRSRLKGSSSTSPTIRYHRIVQDYTLHTYEIPRWLYDEIATYREMTKGYEHPYDLLFSVDAMLHLNYGETRTKRAQKAYSSQELRECITLFYADVLEIEKGYRIVSEDELLKRSQTEEGSYSMDDDEIMMIHPKDTRHLAMINLIMRGANPMTIKDFAGHTNATTSAHYYSNISNTIRCSTKYIYDKFRSSKGTVDYTPHIRINPASLLISPDDPHVEVDGGGCYSPAFIRGSVADCQQCGGRCKVCGFFWPKHGAESPKENIDIEMEYYIKMLKDPNLDDKIEEYQVHALRLEESAVDLATQIWEEFRRREHEQEKNKA